MKKLICDKLHSNLGLEQCVVLTYPVIWEAIYTIKPSEFRTGMAWKALVWEGLHQLQWFQSLHNSQCFFRRNTHTQGKLMELEQHPLMAYSEDLWTGKFWSFSHQLLASAQVIRKSPPKKKSSSTSSTPKNLWNHTAITDEMPTRGNAPGNLAGSYYRLDQVTNLVKVPPLDVRDICGE